MKFIVSKLKKHFFTILLVFIALIIMVKSYTPGTILSGWDTLHPEFDFWLYFKRIFSVWQSHQGLGAPSSQSHIGDLPHAFILWMMAFFLPVNLLRYTYILSMLIIGPLGVYFFLKDHIFNRNKRLQIFAFIGGLFYLLNLGTLQNFYTPLEMFVVLYGLIGWFFWAISCFFENSNKKNLFVIFIITLLLTPSSHTATLWYVFYSSFGLFLLINLVLHKFQKNLLKKSIFIYIFIFLINAFWILPNLYYAKNYSKDVVLSKINRMDSNEFFLRGQKRGTFKDLALITNFPFDWKVYDFDKNIPVVQMDQWQEHTQTPFVKTWGIVLFLFFLIGIILSIIKKNYLLIAFLPAIFLCFFFLRNANFPFTTFFLFLRDRFSFFSEIFRFPFTKFSILYIFLYSIFLSYSFSNLMEFFLKKIPRNIFIHFFTLFFIGQVFFMSPVFKTGYISKTMRIKIPKDYFNLFTYLKQSPNQRILTLPLHNFAGWQYNNWNYQGAGFLWFGLEQSLLNREFDRWYPYNEQAYREFSYALYSRNIDLFAKILQKYQIGYIFLDESIIDTDAKNTRQIIFNRETKALLQQIPSVKLDWQSNFLTLYKTTDEYQEIELAINLPSISPPYRFTSKDEAYNSFENYITANKEADIYYPFRTFLNETDKLSSNITLNLENFYYKADMGQIPEGQFVLPTLQSTEVDFFNKGGSLNFSQTSVYGKIPKQNLIIKSTDIEKIPLEEGINWKKEVTKEKIHYESKDKIIVSSYDLSSLSQDLAYSISFRARNISGLPLRLCIKSLYSRRCEIYDELSKNKNWVEDIFVLPPMLQGMGYKLEISNISFGSILTINELLWIKIAPIPYSFLKGIYIKKPGFERKIEQKIPLNFTDFGFEKIIDPPFDITNGATIILNQAFEKNWKAYYIEQPNFFSMNLPFLFGQEINDHVLVNNWANGWKLNLESKIQNSEYEKIMIIFWPQYLEFLGFGLLMIALLFILLYQSKTQVDEKNV
jgi:hypothetical protein